MISRKQSTRFFVVLTAILVILSSSPRAAFSDPRDVVSERASQFAEEASRIEASEKDLEKFSRGLAENGVAVSDLDRAYADLVKDMTPQQKDDLAKYDLLDFPDELRKKAEAYLALQDQVDESLKELLDRTDSLVKEKLDHMIDVTMDTHQLVKEDLLPGLQDKEAIRGIAPSMKKIEALFNEFKESRALYGKPKDGPTRISFYRRFFAQVRRFDKQLAHIEKKRHLAVEKLGIVWRARERIARVYVELLNLVKLVPELSRMARVAFFPKASEPGKIDFSSNLNKSFRKVAEVMKVPVAIEGREKIPTSKDPKVVNVFAPTHRHAFNDSIIMSHIMPDDALLFGAADQFVAGKPGKILADILDRTEGFVMVGRGSNKPIDEALEQMKTTGSRNLFIYPEGNVSTGLGETRPPRQKFSASLLNRLERQGYKINLIPITYLNADRLLHLEGVGPEGKDQTLIAKIHDPVTPERVAMMLNSGDDQMVGRYLRGVWLQDLPTDEKRISGQWRLSALNEMVPKILYQEHGRSWSFCIQSEILKLLSK